MPRADADREPVDGFLGLSAAPGESERQVFLSKLACRNYVIS